MKIGVKRLADRRDGRHAHTGKNVVELLVDEHDAVKELLEIAAAFAADLVGRVDRPVQIIEHRQHLARQVADLIDKGTTAFAVHSIFEILKILEAAVALVLDVAALGLELHYADLESRDLVFKFEIAGLGRRGRGRGIRPRRRGRKRFDRQFALDEIRHGRDLEIGILDLDRHI